MTWTCFVVYLDFLNFGHLRSFCFQEDLARFYSFRMELVVALETFVETLDLHVVHSSFHGLYFKIWQFWVYVRKGGILFVYFDVLPQSASFFSVLHTFFMSSSIFSFL